MAHLFATLRSRVVLLILLAVIPISAVLIYATAEERRLQTERVSETGLMLARTIAANNQRLVEDTRQLLFLMAQLPELRQNEPATCNSFLQQLISRYPVYTNLGVVNAEGDVICSAVPFTAPVNVSDRRYFRRVFDTRDFSIGDYQVGRITGRTAINFGFPLLNQDDQVAAVVFAALDLDRLNPLAVAAHLPDHTSVTIVDRQGTILARFPESENWVGRPAPEASTLKEILSQLEGVVEGSSADGISRLYSFTSLGKGSPDAPYVLVGIPTSVAFAQVNESAWHYMLALAAVALLAVSAGWFGGDRLVSRRLQDLVRATQRLAAGDLRVRAGKRSSDGELDQQLLYSIVHDITERKQAEEEIRRRTAQQTALNAIITMAAQAGADLKLLLETALEQTLQALGLDMGAIWLIPAPHQPPTFALRGLPEEMAEQMARVAGKERDLAGLSAVEDWEKVSRAHGDILRRQGVRGSLTMPLLFEGRRIGGMSVAKAEPHAWSAEETGLVEAIAGQLGIAVERIRLVVETQQRAEQLALLYDAGIAINSTLEPEAQLRLLIGMAMRALHADRAQFFVYDPVRNQVHYRVGIGHSSAAEEALQHLTVSVGDERGISGWVAQTRTPANVPVVSADPRYISIDPELGSGLWVAVQRQDQLLGILALLSVRPHAFSAEDERLLTLYANQAAIALENARLFEAEKRRTERLAEMQRIGTELATITDKAQVLNTFAARTAALAGSLTCTVMVIDRRTNKAVLEAQYGLPEGTPLGLRVPITLPVFREMIETGAPLIISDVEQVSAEARALLLRKEVRAFFAYPMLHEGRTIGFMTLSHSEPYSPSSEEITLYRLLADRAAAALENAQLFEELQASLAVTTRLYELSGEILEASTLEETARLVVHSLRQGFHSDSACIRVFSHDGLAEFVEGEGLAPSFYRSFQPRPDDFTQQASQSGKPFVVNDLQQISPAARSVGIQTTVIVPLRRRAENFGALYLDYIRPREFVQHELELLPLFANQAALALERVRLLDETRQRVTELEAVNRISTVLRAGRNLDEMLPMLLEETLDVLKAFAASLWLYDPAKDELRQVAARGFPSIAAPLKPGQGIAGQVFLSGEPLVSSDFKSDPRTDERMRAQVPSGLSGAAVPIRTAQAIVGVLFVSVQHPQELSPTAVRILVTVAEIAGNAIHRMRLTEETEQHLHRLVALHEIDRAIASTFDMQFALTAVLNQVTAQLQVDAAAVLLLGLDSWNLEYAAGRGFRSQRITRARMRLGEGLVGEAVSARRTIVVNNVSELPERDIVWSSMADEEFQALAAVPLIVKGKARGVLLAFHRSTFSLNHDWLTFLETLAGQAAIAIDNAMLFADLQRSNADLALAYDTTLEGWSSALDLRDRETEGHTRRVTELTERLARIMSMGSAELVHVRRGALLHDIGKLGVPDAILLKPGPLTEEEWVIMRKHPVLAYELLSPIPYLRPAIDIPYCHHEKWDGTGYPRGLKGEQIPLSARVFAAVDVWDALTSDRPYRAAWSKEKALAHIRAEAGAHFDPEVVQAFLEMRLLSG